MRTNNKNVSKKNVSSQKYLKIYLKQFFGVADSFRFNPDNAFNRIEITFSDKTIRLTGFLSKTATLIEKSKIQILSQITRGMKESLEKKI